MKCWRCRGEDDDYPFLPCAPDEDIDPHCPLWTERRRAEIAERMPWPPGYVPPAAERTGRQAGNSGWTLLALAVVVVGLLVSIYVRAS
ncbi:hypothetical protein NLX83_32990 [Allokutzneria sp. A3M-2-11 16]|uniref:hypothetical protein n=1 Tax=Allokutzneria sp. A3M-2-11 16 TaxID=2962043 RepID=UPI0020B70D4E|nr:hypothetical protein [Allokutzneria sp. A3M-2-11 16]MCP3804099.1 hypothetical protein [Allokutzneria sp. A3M-2-11 16]